MFWLLACHTVSFSLFWMVLWDLCALSHPQVLFLLFKTICKCFDFFESVWNFWRVYFAKLLKFWRSDFQGQYLEIYINMYPNICWVDFLISVCLLQINLCKPPQPLPPHWWVDQASRGPVEQFLGLQRYSETWLASMYQAGLPGSSSWARISWKRCCITVKVLELWVGIHAF